MRINRKSLKIKALAILTTINVIFAGPQTSAQLNGLKPQNLVHLTQEQANSLLQAADENHKSVLPEDFRKELESQLANFYPGIQVETQAVAWYEPPGVYPLVIRSTLADGRKFLINFLYTGSSSSDKYLGTMTFETGSPGIASLYLNKSHFLKISIAQTFDGDLRPAREQTWNKRYLISSQSWEVPCNSTEGCAKAWVWFEE